MTLHGVLERTEHFESPVFNLKECILSSIFLVRSSVIVYFVPTFALSRDAAD
jgi:hypothetical protein